MTGRQSVMPKRKQGLSDNHFFWKNHIELVANLPLHVHGTAAYDTLVQGVSYSSMHIAGVIDQTRQMPFDLITGFWAR